MAEQTMTLPRIPSALRRAKEAAEQEAQASTTSLPSSARVEPAEQPQNLTPSQPDQGSGAAAQPQTYQFTGFEEKKQSNRLTRTFTLEPETEAKLVQTARKYGVSKSAVMERAFLDWYELVNDGVVQN